MSNENAFIKTGNQEYIKTYVVYDVNNRATDVYEARANAQDGEYALRTRYQFDGVSTRVTASIEENSTWQAIWDF